MTMTVKVTNIKWDGSVKPAPPAEAMVEIANPGEDADIEMLIMEALYSKMKSGPWAVGDWFAGADFDWEEVSPSEVAARAVGGWMPGEIAWEAYGRV